MADKNISGGVQYRVAPREGGKYFAVERRSNGSSDWVSEGSSAPTKEEAEKIVLNLSQGKTANGQQNVSEVPTTNKPLAMKSGEGISGQVSIKETPEESSKPALGGMSTEKWVAEQKDAGLSDDEIIAAYEKEGFSRDGAKFKAAMEKYTVVPPVEEKQSSAPRETSTEEAPAPKEEKKESTYGNKSSAIGKYLARNMITAYKNGDFGEPGSTEAKITMGKMLLNEIGTRLANASSIARGGSGSLQSDWSKMQANNEEVNKSIRAYEAQYNAAKEEVLASMSESDRNSITPAELDSKVLELLQRKGVTTPQSREGLATTDQSGTVKETEIKKGVVELKNLTQQQKQTATQNLTALLARRSELQKAIAALQADQGWDAYKTAMEAYVGTARGLESVGLSSNTSEAINKGSTVGISANIGTGSVVGKFANASLSGNTSWSSSALSSSGKSASSSEDALAKARFKDGDSYANASADARKEANAQLIANLQSEIAVINKAIESWGKDLGVEND